VALQLKRHGVTRVRPLLGGLALWMDRQFPVESVPDSEQLVRKSTERSGS
jgi:3-mercaptopyruvate sulfurtransferase SseA